MTESDDIKALTESTETLVQYLKRKNLEENDMLLAKLRHSRSKAERMREFSEENYRQVMNELDAAEAEILRIRSEI